MLVRDFTLMVEHRESLMDDAWVGDYRFMVRWQRGEKYRKELQIAGYGLWVLKEKIEVLRSHLSEAKRWAHVEPDTRSLLFSLREECVRLHEAVQYAEGVLSDPHLARSGNFYDPRFVESLGRVTHQLESLVSE